MKKEKEIKKRIKIRINFFFTKVKKPFLKIKIDQKTMIVTLTSIEGGNEIKQK